jgi:outer membrane protein
MTHSGALSIARRLVQAALALVVLGAPARPAAAQQPAAPAPAASASRFAWVNSQLIIRQVPGYTAAESTLNADIAGFRGEVERLQTQLDSMVGAYDRQQIALSPSARTAKQQEIREMQQRLQARYGELQTRAAERERELVAPLEERVKGIIEGLRAERNLAFIFDVGAPGNNIVAADRALDLTALVVQRLQPAGQ